MIRVERGTALDGLATALAGVVSTLFALGLDRGSVAIWAPSLVVLIVGGALGAVACVRRVAEDAGDVAGVASVVRTPDNEV